MRIIFDINPCPASRPRVTRWSTYYPKKYTQFKKDMIALTSELDITPSESLLSVDIGFYIGMPKSWSKKKKELKNGQYCDNNADVDNYLKAILDSLNEVIYVDDRQIVEIYAKKLYSDKPCIKFNMKIIGDSTNDKGRIM
tara:strand:- start:197 stop:616 length:420 start_codon:yes stop_codon:yes gene_type:complete